MAFLNDITLGQYYPGTSFIHRLDPRSKLLASLILMTCLLISNQLFLVGAQAIACFSLIRLTQIPLVVFAKNLKWFIWLFLITFAVHALDPKLHSTLPYIAFSISEPGIQLGFIYTARLALLIIFAAILTLTTSPVELADGVERLLAPLKRLKLPVHEFALMMTLAMRFIPILLREAERIKNAQISRGASLQGPLHKRVKNIVPMIIPLFISAIRKADDLAVAMAARNYVGGDGRTSFRMLVLSKEDYVAVCCSLILLAVILAIRLSPSV